MAVTTRFSTVRLEKKLSAALALASGNTLEHFYTEDAKHVNDIVSARISRSGVGGDHNDKFAHQDQRVFRAASGRYNVSVGWLYPSLDAAERGSGGRLWYQYQDSGFHLFGGSQWQEGVMATIDRREMLVERMDATNRMYVQELAKILER